MEQSVEIQKPEKRESEKYQEPLLIKHEPLRDITGAKYGEKTGGEKFAAETA